MKVISVIGLFVVILYSSEIEHMKIHQYNKKATVKLQKENLMKKYAKVDEEKLKEIVKKATNEKIIYKKIKHQNTTIYYKVLTKSYILKIDAISGEILKKEKR
ncbi:PepSY domain-containing protein [Nitrosophilus kaiyonis]|uniref:PepSY domain-containing protein n=1 Tax=Nitrosophilus kaiyonis TaxID=2930200 RepID=UPI00248FAC55|nr:PepSY domain-containing protein [Nitrosophilus kaiyonis]